MSHVRIDLGYCCIHKLFHLKLFPFLKPRKVRITTLAKLESIDAAIFC